MTIEIDEDYTTDTSANYVGASINVDTVQNQIEIDTDDGIAVYNQAIAGGGDIWMSVTMEDFLNDDGLAGPVIGANGDPDGSILLIGIRAGDEIFVDNVTEYANGTAYQSNDEPTDISIVSGVSNGDRLGLTLDYANELVRIFYNPTADQPSSVTDWDGTNDFDATVDFSAWDQPAFGRYIGIGTWDTSPNPTGIFGELRGGQIGAGATTHTGTGTPAAQSATAAGTGEITKTGSGAPAAQAATVSGSANLEHDGSGAASAQSAAAAGTGSVLGNRQVVLTAANNAELRDASNQLWANVNGWVWEWYDTPGSTAGSPVDSGTFNTDVNGESTVLISASSLAVGQFGQLLVYHPTLDDVRATLRVAVS